MLKKKPLLIFKEIKTTQEPIMILINFQIYCLLCHRPFFELKNKIGCKNLHFKTFIEGDIHLNKVGNRMIESSFLKKYNN